MKALLLEGWQPNGAGLKAITTALALLVEDGKNMKASRRKNRKNDEFSWPQIDYSYTVEQLFLDIRNILLAKLHYAGRAFPRQCAVAYNLSPLILTRQLAIWDFPTLAL